jgi:translocation and assembly module TamA
MAVAGLLVAAAASLPARADEDEPPIIPDAPESPSSEIESPSDGNEDTPSSVHYKVKITGIEDEQLKKLMKESSQLIALEKRPPTTMSGLSRRIEEDIGRFEKVLRSQGYYRGTASYRIDRDKEPVRVIISVVPGAPFLVTQYEIHYVGKFADDPPPPKPTAEELGLELGARAEAAKIVAAGAKLLNILGNDARPLAKQTDRRAIADFREDTVEVDVSIDPGPRATYGQVTITGLKRTKESFVRQWIPWNEGEPYKKKQMDSLQSNLINTGLFSSVIVEHAETVDERGQIAITIALEEEKPRSVGGGISVSTDRGVGGRVFWRHGNLFGHDENLEVSAMADFIEQRGTVSYERPNFKRAGRSAYAQAGAGWSDTDAYTGFDSSLSGGIRWPVSKRWTASLGGLVEYSDLKDDEESASTLLWGVPGTLRYDGTSNKLDPKKGVRLELILVPYVGTSGKVLTFNSTEVGVSGYYPLDEEKRYVLAGRTRVGSLVGESRQNIPLNKRLYAGGGGSIRGYAYQKVGPLDDDRNPIGGRSKIEFSGEVRARVYEDFGLVPFFAAGNVYDSVLPDFSSTMQWAAGLGFRYFTAIGPLRLDVAVPINPRSKVDAPFQIYFSIGQAF